MHENTYDWENNRHTSQLKTRNYAWRGMWHLAQALQKKGRMTMGCIVCILMLDGYENARIFHGELMRVWLDCTKHWSILFSYCVEKFHISHFEELHIPLVKRVNPFHICYLYTSSYNLYNSRILRKEIYP